MLHAAAAMGPTPWRCCSRRSSPEAARPAAGEWPACVIAGGIMLAPQLGSGVMILLGMVGHIGTSVPLLLIWLVLDRMRARWYLPVVTGVLLAWCSAVGDSLVLALGVAPLVLVCAVRVVQGLLSAARARGSGASTPRAARVRRELRSRWLELSLACAALAAAGDIEGGHQSDPRERWLRAARGHLPARTGQPVGLPFHGYLAWRAAAFRCRRHQPESWDRARLRIPASGGCRAGRYRAAARIRALPHPAIPR